MANRLATCFDVAVEASLAQLEPDDLPDQVAKYLADAHAIEQQALQLLDSAPGRVEAETLAPLFRQPLVEPRRHKQLVEKRLESCGASPSLAKDTALRAGALNLGAFFGAQPDTTTKLAGVALALAHLAIAAHALLPRVA